MNQPTDIVSMQFSIHRSTVGLLAWALLCFVSAGCASNNGRLAVQTDGQNERVVADGRGQVTTASFEPDIPPNPETMQPLPDLHDGTPLQGSITLVYDHALQGHSLSADPRMGVQCVAGCNECGAEDWKNERPIPWEVFAQGEYIGPARSPHLPEYRLRVDDSIEFVYRLTGEATTEPYRLNVGDELRIESLTVEGFDRTVIIQPDGTITLSRVGQVTAAGLSVQELRASLNKIYSRHLRDPNFVVTPLKLNSVLQELRSSVDGRFGNGGQNRQARVTPEGTVQLPAIGSVSAQGLTLAELQNEIEHRYSEFVHGLEVTAILIARAPRAVYVVGEVRNPGRFTLEGPTTVMQSIALAGSWNIGAKLNHIVVLRRDENWQLVATRLQLHDAFFGKKPCPDGEIWLRDNDIVIVPKSHIQWTGDLIEMFFTRGLYGVLPVNGAFQLRNLSIL